MQILLSQNNMKEALISSSPTLIDRVWFYYFILMNFNYLVPKYLLLDCIKSGVLMTEVLMRNSSI